MSIVGVNDLKDANGYENGLENAASVQVKLQKAQELIGQMNEELSSIMENIEMKKFERDRKGSLLYHLRYMSRGYGYWFPMTPCWSITLKDSFDRQAEPTIGEQDELIQNLRYKLIQESISLAEERKLIRRIKEAEEIRESLVSNRKPDEVGEQDELIQNLRYKLFHESNSLAEEKKLNRHIKEAEEMRKIMVSNRKPDHTNDKETKTNHLEVYRAKIHKLKYNQQEAKKAAEDLEYTCKELQLFQEDLTRLYEKRRQVHRIIYHLVKQQEKVPESRHAENIICTTDTLTQVTGTVMN